LNPFSQVRKLIVLSRDEQKTVSNGLGISV